MRRTPYLGLALVGLLLGSCTPSVRPTDVTLERYDQDTEYAVTPRDNGFTLTIYYSRGTSLSRKVRSSPWHARVS